MREADSVSQHTHTHYTLKQNKQTKKKARRYCLKTSHNSQLDHQKHYIPSNINTQRARAKKKKKRKKGKKNPWAVKL